MTETVNYTDIWYQVKYTFNENSLDFVAHEIESMSADNKPVDIRKDESMKGYVKFDGCMNVIFESGYAHFCGRQNALNYAELFNKIYDRALEIGFTDK